MTNVIVAAVWLLQTEKRNSNKTGMMGIILVHINADSRSC